MKKNNCKKQNSLFEPVRLQKFLSMGGIASRRTSEKMIKDGLVRVNGHIIREMGTKVDPQKDTVIVQGKPVKIQGEYSYYLFYKPVGCLTTVKDDKDRATIFHYLKNIKEKVFPVGRLDFNTEGLLLITNDGELANTLSHPSHKVEKTYLARVSGIPKETALKKLERGGLTLPDGKKTAPMKVALVRTTGKNAWVQFKLSEGKNRQIREMCARVGHPVSKLKRVKIGYLNCAGLRPGDYRTLDRNEISGLRSISRLKTKAGKTVNKVGSLKKHL